MNKSQKDTAKKLLHLLKEHNGSLTDSDIKEKVGMGDALNQFSILGCLEDLNLINKVGNRSYRLTSKGWGFSSFSSIQRQDFIKKAKENISFILNIILIATTIYITFINSGLKEENTSLKYNITELKSRMSTLETHLNYLKIQTEKPQINTKD